MNEMIVRPKAQNEKGKRVFLLTLIGCAVTFVASLMLPSYSGIVQLLSLILLCISLYFYNRYVGSTYTYEIASDEMGGALFIVRQEVGKRSSTHCRMSVRNLRSAVRMSREELRAYKQRRNSKKGSADPSSVPESNVGVYFYGPTFLPESVCLLSFRGRFERADVFIECTDELCEYLLSLSETLRESYFEEE